MLGDRYAVLKALGKGTYGQVLLCHDTKTGAQVAIKVARGDPAYRRAAMNEIGVLRALVNNGDTLNMLGYFEHRKCLCIVTEVLQMSLLDILQGRGYRPLPLRDVHVIAGRVLRALAALHDIGYMHCDVKPENVMLRPPTVHHDTEQDFKGTCLIDFGAVRQFRDNRYYDIQSLWYRAPEVMLCVPYTHRIDSWSVGCLLYELYTGEPLFYGANPQDLLSLISHTVGLPRQERSMCGADYPAQSVVWRGNAVDAETNIRHLVLKLRSKTAENCKSGQLLAEEEAFVNLISRLLEPDERRRLSCSDALSHPFFTQHCVHGGHIEPTVFRAGSDEESSVCGSSPSADFVSSSCNAASSGVSVARWEKRPGFAAQSQRRQQLSFPPSDCTRIPLVGVVGHPTGVVITSSQPSLASSIPGSPLHLLLPPVAYPNTVTALHSAPAQVHQQVHVPPLFVGARTCTGAPAPPNYPNNAAASAGRSGIGARFGNDSRNRDNRMMAADPPGPASLQMVRVAPCAAVSSMYKVLVGNPMGPVLYASSKT
ncbi:protein kinase, putative [Trypanosoma brucei gambiense DAL972]|uniref:Protein kinase, putative n=2 Tax=Trypanosoma brucei TaxID=5691 RepID=D0A485_TRYB9|nr:protein kinase, putative [Trypanosoma brucei gambiense DAL972]RHW69228.1 serine/threonine kinase [Trypanosoma brucei equiperdum]CBH16079.1 protein kinase, putative [Trypanosoma brucei gambiense DAL972]|eukprot:XP_011778343.1 protein kinase, putative [Trypanosoma brucei gambiense DAL972]